MYGWCRGKRCFWEEGITEAYCEKYRSKRLIRFQLLTLKENGVKDVIHFVILSIYYKTDKLTKTNTMSKLKILKDIVKRKIAPYVKEYSLKFFYCLQLQITKKTQQSSRSSLNFFESYKAYEGNMPDKIIRHNEKKYSIYRQNVLNYDPEVCKRWKIKLFKKLLHYRNYLLARYSLKYP